MCRYRCWNLATVRPKPATCGRMRATTGRLVARNRRRCGSPTRRIEKGNIRRGTCGNYTGILQADGYAGFNKLYEKGRILEAACWAHVRRKFHDLYQAHRSPIAKEALERIGQLYAIEREIRGQSLAERKEVRQARSRPLLESMHIWWKATLAKLSQKSDVAMAIRYALDRWGALLRFCDDGRVEMDNNAAERALRAVALGRRTICLPDRTPEASARL